MTTSAIGASDPYQAGGAQNNNFQKVRTDFKQLSDALTSGSVDQAQQALSTLQSDLPSGASNSPLGKALDGVSQALQSGDVNGAQQALSSLKGHHHHHHHQSQTPDASTTSTPQPTANASQDVGRIVNASA
jgi:soluble cytochrome b562